jgi:hypothetical protein
MSKGGKVQKLQQNQIRDGRGREPVKIISHLYKQMTNLNPTITVSFLSGFVL